MFLNYHGGSGSGVWSAKFGNSLSVPMLITLVVLSTPVPWKKPLSNLVKNTLFLVLNVVVVPIVVTIEKVLLLITVSKELARFCFEFEMPSDTNGNGYNQDMPAVWLLNAKIPRTLQYGEATCSCWKTGCGELDLFEVLSSGSNKMISPLARWSRFFSKQ